MWILRMSRHREVCEWTQSLKVRAAGFFFVSLCTLLHRWPSETPPARLYKHRPLCPDTSNHTSLNPKKGRAAKTWLSSCFRAACTSGGLWMVYSDTKSIKGKHHATGNRKKREKVTQHSSSSLCLLQPWRGSGSGKNCYDFFYYYYYDTWKAEEAAQQVLDLRKLCEGRDENNKRIINSKGPRLSSRMKPNIFYLFFYV